MRYGIMDWVFDHPLVVFLGAIVLLGGFAFIQTKVMAEKEAQSLQMARTRAESLSVHLHYEDLRSDEALRNTIAISSGAAAGVIIGSRR